MRIVQATEFGGPEVLRPAEAPDPAPGPGELLIDVAVAEVHGQEGWTARVGGEVGVVFDGAGGQVGADAFALVRRGGRFFSYGSAAGSFPDVAGMAAERGIEVIGIEDGFTAEDMHRAAELALEQLGQGAVVPVIGQTVPLEQAADAHAAIAERRVAGKTLLLP